MLAGSYPSLMSSDPSAPTTALPDVMYAVLLTGHGGFERLDYRDDVPVPVPLATEVLVRVGAAGVNNTDVNTRIGWYSKSVTSGTDVGASDGLSADVTDDGDWAGEGLSFPRIQGADVAGQIVAVGSEVDPGRIGERVIVRTMQAKYSDDDPTSCVTFGSELDGGFAQFCRVDHREAFEVNSPMTDVELASFPCAYSTAEGMLHRAEVTSGDRVLITGASGGVGSAAVQLAKRRGAEVIAVASAHKWDVVRGLGADQMLDRDTDLAGVLGDQSVDVVVDLVAGDTWPNLLDVLKRQGRYVVAGAIAGPIVTLDVRMLYLKDLTLMGCTQQPRVVFENLVSYIENGEIVPVVAGVYDLMSIEAAQRDFLEKASAGKLVLVPPPESP